MSKKNTPIPTHSTHDKSLVLQLIAEELKIQKILSVLRELGLSECAYDFFIYEIIINSMGLNPESDEVMDRYTRIIEKSASKLKPGRWAIVKEAERVYRELKDLQFTI